MSLARLTASRRRRRIVYTDAFGLPLNKAGPIPVARERYELYPGAANFHLRPVDGGFAVTAALELETRGQTAFSGTVETEILAPGARGARAPRAADVSGDAREPVARTEGSGRAGTIRPGQRGRQAQDSCLSIPWSQPSNLPACCT